MDNYYLSILVCCCLISITNGLTDITTKYEINTLMTDMKEVKYLNTCTVSVHVPADVSQLPLFNGSISGTNIPQLYNSTTMTTWKRLNGGSILPDYVEETLFFLFKITKFNMNLPPLSHLTLQKPVYYNLILTSGTVFNESIMNNLHNTTESLQMNTLVIRINTTMHTSTQLYWDSNDDHFIEITNRNGKKLTVCYYNEQTECREFEFSFKVVGNSESTLLVPLYRKLIISDYYSNVVLYTDFHLPKDFTKYTRVKNVHHDISITSYFLFQAKTTHIASPWLEMKSNTAVFIFYFARPGHTVTTSLEDETTNTIVQLDGVELDRVDYTEDLERVLTKVNIPSWTGKKRIRVDGDKTIMGNIWEQTELDKYKIEGPVRCDKSNMMNIYNTLERSGTSEPVDICFNGGRLKNDTCACPPGYAGNQCELTCDRNRFGQTCSSICSKSSNECKGIILCTPDYGCTCAPGYHGDQCIQQCQEGTYGADCAQTCDHCNNGCDRYTGACKGGCSKPFLIRPYCKQTHSYLKKAAEIVDTSFSSVQLQVDLTPNNVVRSSANVMTYLVQYREDNSIVWNDGPSEVFSPVMSNILVEGLNPGRVYEFRVLLVDETQESQDPLLSITTKGHTKCSVSVKDEYLHIDSISNTSIGLSWDNETGPRNTECPTENYSLEVDELTDTGYVKSREVVNMNRNWYQLETLSPGQTYYIKLNKTTTNGETVTISRQNITTDDTVDLAYKVVGVTIKKTNSQIKIDWFPISIYKKYFVKYNLKKYISCNKHNVKSSLEIKETTSTTTNLSLLNLEPYAYYELFVTADKNQMMKEFNSSFITPGTVPTASPTLLSALTKVTNESIHLFLTNYSDSCERMNGVFKKYKMELYDYPQKLIESFETKDDNLDITGLQSETQYLLKIYFVNHVGYNPTVSLQYNFKTKPNTLIRELTAYKTTPTMIGLRWKVPDISTILAINIELRSDTDSKTINLTSSLHSLQCKPWPDFYCIEVNELMENNKYNITVDAFSKELPEGSISKPILVITKETAPSAVSDIKLNYSSDTNMAQLSWQIPYTLNGTLRSFDIQLEQLSSFDDQICCQINKTVYPVSEEQEIYSMALQDMKPASSYQITIRPLTKRLGPEAKEIIQTAPPRVPFQRVPLVRIDEKKIEFPIKNNSEKSFNNVYKTLATEILIIKQIIEGETNKTSNTTDNITTENVYRNRRNTSTPLSVQNTNQTSNTTESIQTELSQILGNNKNWVLIHVCKIADLNCTVDIKPDSNESDSSFKILLVQVNQYLSAKSYTILESSQFHYRDDDDDDDNDIGN